MILLTTKKTQHRKAGFNVDVAQGTGKVNRMPVVMTTLQYLDMRREALRNDHLKVGERDYDLNGTWDTCNVTNWPNLLIGGTAKYTDLKAGYYREFGRTKFNVGTNYQKESTVFPDDFYNATTASTIGISHISMNGKLEGEFSISYTNEYRYSPPVDFTGSILMTPNLPSLYDNKGQYNWDENRLPNPLAVLLQKSTSLTQNLLTSANLVYHISANLQLQTNVGYHSSRMEEHFSVPFGSLIPLSNEPFDQRKREIASNGFRTLIVEMQMTYRKDLKSHHLDFLLGGTFQRNLQTGFLLTETGFSSDELLDGDTPAASSSRTPIYNPYRYVGFFARVGYNFKKKYILNLTARRDGSSRFGPKRNYGNFGAIGAAWIFTNENLFANKNFFLSFGKIRGSIGRTGNDQFKDFLYLNTYIENVGYMGSGGVSPSGIVDPYYSWEIINKIDLGTELGFIKNRIIFVVSYFQNHTTNQLLGHAVSSVAGFTTVTSNLPARIQNKGYEFELKSVNIEKEKFKWNSSFNISFLKNKLISFPNLPASYASSYVVGQPLPVKLVNDYKGVDPNTGAYKIDYINNADELARVNKIPVFVGPQYFGGFKNSVTYGKCSLDVFLQFVKQSGNLLVSNTMPGRRTLYGANQMANVTDRWQNKGDVSRYQRYSTTADMNNRFMEFSQSTGAIGDASYVRVKSISFSYSLPAKKFLWKSLQQATLYARAENLFTFTKFPGIDPETQGTVLPPLRMITTGVQAFF